MKNDSESKPLTEDEKALVKAALDGDVETVRALLTKGVPVDIRDSESYSLGMPMEITPLMCAAAKGHAEVVRVLLGAGASVSAESRRHKADGGGREQPLHYASLGKDPAVLELLLDAGADANAHGNGGWTPLAEAVRRDNLDAVRVLLKRGAEVNLKSRKKQHTLPLNFAVVAKERDKLVTVKEGDKEVKRLISIYRNPEIFRTLMEAGADPNATDETGYSALLALAWEANIPDDLLVPMMEALIKAGANVNFRPAEENAVTPLYAAVMRNNPTAVRLLAAAGADVNCIVRRETALDVAEQQIKTAEKTLSDPSIRETLREVVTASLKRAREIVAILKQFGRKTKAEFEQTAPPAGYPAPAAGPASVKEAASLGAADFLKFIYDGEAEWALLAVRAPIEQVTNALAKLWKARSVTRNAPLKDVEEENDELAPLVIVAQVPDNSWVVIYRSLYYAKSEQLEGVATAAKELSKELKAQAISFGAEDTSAWLGYELFEKGKSVEKAEWSEGNGFDVFKSTRRGEPDVEEVDDKFVDGVFRELGIYLPVCYPKSTGKRSWLAVDGASENRVERADLMALREGNPRKCTF